MGDVVMADDIRWEDGSIDPVRAVSAPGTYRLEAELNGCVAADSITVTTNPTPDLELGPDSTACQGDFVTLVAEGNATAFLWQDGSTESTFTASATGVYFVEASLNGCTATDSVALNFQERPQFELGADTSICQGESVLLDGTAGPGVIYQWEDGSSQPLRTVSTSGAYRLEATLNGCSQVDSISVSVDAVPTVDLGADQTACQGESIVLDAGNPGASYRWQDGSTGQQLEVRASGAYSVEVSNGDCSASDEVQLTFQAAPQLELGPDQQICAGESVTLDGAANAGGVQYVWEDGSTDPVRTVDASGQYRLEADLMGCIRRDTVNITVIDLPTLDLGADQIRCADEEVVLDATINGANTYRWQDGSSQPRFTVAETGTYFVEASVDGQCGQRDTVKVSLREAPVFELGNDTLLCEGQPLSLTINTEADRYRWSTGAQGPSIRVARSNLIWGEAAIGRCVTRDSILVEFEATPRVNLGPDTTVCQNEPLLLDPGTFGSRYTWQDGSTASTLVVNESGLYWVEVANGRCFDRDSVQITVQECNRSELYLPNAFSPDEDGANDLWLPGIPSQMTMLAYRCVIFDRWGNQVFNTGDPTVGWDGTYRGSEMPQGVYVYVVKYIHLDENEQQQTKTISGDVTLLR